MAHFSKYITIALASMSTMKAGLISFPLPHGFPEVNFMFVKETNFTQGDWEATEKAGEGHLQHILHEVPKRIINIREDKRHALTAMNVVWGMLLLEGSFTETNNPKTIENGYFDQKFSAGLRINKNCFLKFNLSLWNDKVLFPLVVDSSFCIHPSILWKTAWFNVDIGFGSDKRMKFPQDIENLTDNQYQRLVKKTIVATSFLKDAVDVYSMLSFPIRISVSLNVISLGSQ